ncbi:hypothetical protein F2Q69_00044798 [Brassica cretica]|uniref:Uncharacterized protein n=1 Tax=Brassica cretica TaxID=69181 RepID=A0A8S9NM19_BRACR|nr:hypothetical protein F2Q69_00044798 [Brassica cretica]
MSLSLLGRKPLARFPSGDWVISEMPVTQQDLKLAVSKVFDIVGRVVSGSAEIIRDLIEGGGSILVIGSPGVGKTTLIRKRVVIVDTSNEIGGDGDVPHSGIGRARRMQIPNVNLQHDGSPACDSHSFRDDVPHKLVTPIPLENLKEEPAPSLNIDFASEVFSDDEDEDFLPTPYLKAGSNISKSQRSSHVHVYTHNETLTGDEFRETFIYTDKPLNADDRVRIKDLISV